MAPTVLERIDAALAVAGEVSPSAVGWATVDLDRAASELIDALGLGRDAFGAADDSVALGGRCRIARDALPDGRSLVILEPSTEGRLAGRLARLGEGPVAIWLPPGPAVESDGREARPGPFGPERLLPGGPAQGPYRLLIVARPGTIAG